MSDIKDEGLKNDLDLYYSKAELEEEQIEIAESKEDDENIRYIECLETLFTTVNSYIYDNALMIGEQLTIDDIAELLNEIKLSI